MAGLPTSSRMAPSRFGSRHLQVGGTAGPDNLTNGVLSQTVSATAGDQYQFSGWSLFEANYSGGVDTLNYTSPLGAVASPTVTTDLIMEFLDSGNNVIGSPLRWMYERTALPRLVLILRMIITTTNIF